MEDVLEGKDYNFPKVEESILELWEKLDAFKTQLKKTEGKPEFVFFDGPPFATGLPHYGHILAGTIKDIVTRYASTTGHHVSRRFGWDCHGLPVEYEIDQKLGIKSKDDVLKMGIGNYNEECRSIVMRYSKEWEKTVTRLGRWIDFKNDYKTLDPSYMESVWWVFKQLYDKGLVYKGFKVMPYSTGCTTPLSNFEAGLNYKDVNDPAVMVAFPLVGDPDGAALVAWTTTPWTLPSNLALCVNAAFTYVKVKDRASGAVYMVAESRLSQLPSKKAKKGTDAAPAAANGVAAKDDGKKGAGHSKKGAKKDKKEGPENGVAPAPALDTAAYEVLGKTTGEQLKGAKYTPLFNFFDEQAATAFRVLADDYVTDDSGTGVVHCAPAFGEDDYHVCLAGGIITKGGDFPIAVDDDGRFTAKVADFQGRYVKEADKDILAAVKAKGRLVNVGTIVHPYPFCWRSETPLIYKAVPSWFVAVESIKDRLLVANAQTHWVPAYVKEKRFQNWLENARDWAISRNRYWGTPLPIWHSPDWKEMVVVGSVEQLEQLSGFKATDLHRHRIDHVTIPSKRGPEHDLKRCEEVSNTDTEASRVFDCWFESGAMPYAQAHYPFENKERMENNFPADFVAEGLDQTRGWFYTLMVLSTALFDKPAFKNLICNGLVLAEDGKKMSKRLRNYPDPSLLISEYGADALRLYLINSPVVKAEPLRFKKDGVFAVIKDVFLPWYNAYRFFVQNVLRLEAESGRPFVPSTGRDSDNVLDHWIHSATDSLVLFVRAEMAAYRLYTVVPFLLRFIDNLTNIYVRYNRKRLKGSRGDEDCRTALSTLYHVLRTVCCAMAPFTPFFTEVMYQNLRRAEGPQAEASVHFCAFPTAQSEVDPRIEQSVARMQTVIDLGRNIREKRAKPVKQPLKSMTVVHSDAAFLEDMTGKLRDYVLEELNVRTLAACNDPLQFATLRADPDLKVLGKRLGKAMGAVTAAVRALDTAALLQYEERGQIEVAGHTLGPGDLRVTREFKAPPGSNPDHLSAAGDGDVLVVLDLREDEELQAAGLAREVVNRVQKLRKKAGLVATDAVEVYMAATGPSDDALVQALAAQQHYVREALGMPLLQDKSRPTHAVVLAREKHEGVGGTECAPFELVITRPALVFTEHLLTTCGGIEEHAENVRTVLLSREYGALRVEAETRNEALTVAVEGQPKYSVTASRDFFWNVGDSLKL